MIEKWYSRDTGNLTIGIANRRNLVAMSGSRSIAENKRKILDIIDTFKGQHVNMVLFPEFSLTGYFWQDTPACWDYMRKGVTNEHLQWLSQIKSKLDDTLQYVIFNNIRLHPDNPRGRFLNSTYVIDKQFDCTNLNTPFNEAHRIYDKTFLPGIEKTFTVSGKQDALVLDTAWGKFGFATCYDMCFTQLFQEYAIIDKVDAMIELASWRGSAERSYPGMDVQVDHYYGYIWDAMAAGQAAFNQVWLIAGNAVGEQKRGNYTFWGGSGLWAPSGIKLVQASTQKEQLLIVHNINITGAVQDEHDDFYYYEDFRRIYTQLENLRTFTRVEQ